MKNNKILSMIAGAALLTLMPACTNLDETVYDKLAANEFGKTKTEINALVGSVYNTLKTYWPNNFMYLSECGGSMAVTPTRKGGDWYDGGQYRELYMHTWTAETSQIKGSWSAASSAIGSCNAYYNVIANSPVLTEAERTMLLSEIRGVRAFWMYAMMDNWGNVPLVTEYKEERTKDDIPTVTPRQEIFDWLIKEVTEIAESCPEPSASTYGKFTKGAAYTLLAKLYLNAEAWGVSVAGGNAYTKAVEACNKVMSMSYYILEPDWKTNFNPNNNVSKEAIFACAFSSQDTKNQNTMMNRTLHYKYKEVIGASMSTWNGVCAQPDYVKLFDVEDPRYEGTFIVGQQYNKQTGEPIKTDHGFLLDHTVDVTILPGTERDGTNWGDVNQHDGARCQKWPYEQSLVDAMENDFHIFRLADVYLMKAEALLRSGGSVAEATNLVNQIRSRAYGDNNHNYATVDLDKILLERRFELAWEGHSRQDDIRFGVFEIPMWKSSNCERAKGEHLKLYPISQDAWQTNPNLVQNPGYPAFASGK